MNSIVYILRYIMFSYLNPGTRRSYGSSVTKCHRKFKWEGESRYLKLVKLDSDLPHISSREIRKFAYNYVVIKKELMNLYSGLG